jgi:hypothetical protein
MEKESFIYTISSEDRLNSIGVATTIYDINFGGFNSNHDDFRIEVVNFVLNGNVLAANGFLILAAENLHSNGVFCREILSSQDCILCSISTNADTLMSSGGITFNVNNCRINKRIRFKLLLPDLTPAISTTDINIGAETVWLLTLQVIPLSI